jgi:uncharacterized protein YhaN
MKIRNLNLDAFGPFTGVALDLSAGHHGLHMVYGPNEAGKTSALRALRALLYGIGGQTSDNFIHEYKKMRLSAELARSDGSVLEIVRYKKNKNALCGGDGTTPIAPEELERFLGGVDDSLFTTMFGIGHAELVKGGQEIIKGGGRLGEVLFSASSGIAGLRGVQEALRSEMDTLFKPTGRNQRIPVAIAEVRSAQQKIRDAQVTPEDWSRHDQALSAAEAENGRLEQLLAEKQRELSRLKRIRQALPLVSERAELRATLETLRDAATLPADFAARRREAELALARSNQERERAARALAEHRARCAPIQVPEELLVAGKDIEALISSRGAIRKALEDRPNLVSLLQDHEHSARDILQSLGRPRDLAEAERFRLLADDSGQVQKLALKAQELDTRRDEARKASAQHRRRSEKLRGERDSLGPVPDAGLVRGALSRAVKLGDIESRADEAHRQCAELERSLAVAIAQLVGWSGSAEELQRQPIPLVETIAKFEDAFDRLQQHGRELAAERARKAQEAAELEARLHAEIRNRDLPSEEDLLGSRSHRDEGWKLVRRAWLEGIDDEATIAFVNAHDRGSSLADAYEHAVSSSDELADRLRREASDVAQRAERLTALEGARARLESLTREEAAAQNERNELTGRWNDVLATLGLAAMTPAELRSWLAQRARILEVLSHFQAARADAEQLDRQIAEHRRKLVDAITTFEPDLPRAELRLSDLVERGQARVAALDQAARRREAVETTLEKELSDLEEAEARLRAIDEEQAAWRVAWSQRIARIGLEPDSTPDQANVYVDKIRELQQHLKDARILRTRIESIDRDAAHFAESVATLARRVAADLVDLPPAEATERLYARLREARELEQTKRGLLLQIAEEEQSLETATRALEATRITLEALCRDAGCAELAELPAAEQRSDRRARCEADLKRCEQQIRNQTAGATVEAFIAEVDSLDPDTLDLAVERLDLEIAELEQQRNQVNQSIGSEKQILATMDGRSAAAEANGQIGHLLAQLQADVPRYAALRLASHVLQKGIERYRERGQGPVLDRASALFARLTCGSFAGLKIDYNDKGDPVLVGVRPGGESCLTVDCMSDGSCDQLYLALRIASLERWLVAHEPIPLVVDDILLHFDDARSTAALEILADLSHQTQVLFFTHHAHLVELARSCLKADALFIHELAASPMPEPAAAGGPNGE